MIRNWLLCAVHFIEMTWGQGLRSWTHILLWAINQNTHPKCRGKARNTPPALWGLHTTSRCFIIPRLFGNEWIIRANGVECVPRHFQHPVSTLPECIINLGKVSESGRSLKRSRASFHWTCWGIYHIELINLVRTRVKIQTAQRIWNIFNLGQYSESYTSTFTYRVVQTLLEETFTFCSIYSLLFKHFFERN